MFDCLVAGDSCIDILVDGIITLEPGTEKLATDLNLVLGGSSAITAFNLSRLGRRVSFAGVVGQDWFGHFIEEKLTAGGVDLTGLQKTSSEKTGVTIWHSGGGKRAGVTYAGTIAMLAARHITDTLLKTARHLHVGAYFLEARLHADAPGLFARAKALGLTTSVDCNYDPVERWDSNLRGVLESTDFFFPNEDEALAITGARNVSDAARQLTALVQTVVIKRGENGVFVATPDTQFEIPAIPVQVVDTTGAGDSFNAGFLAKFLVGAELEECAQAGIVAASRSVQKLGGTAAFEA